MHNSSLHVGEILLHCFNNSTQDQLLKLVTKYYYFIFKISFGSYLSNKDVEIHKMPLHGCDEEFILFEPIRLPTVWNITQ